MAETLKDFLIGIGFDVDEAGANQADDVLESLQDICLGLGQALKQAANAINGLMNGFLNSIDETDKGAESLAGAAEAANALTAGESSAADAAYSLAQAQAQTASSALSAGTSMESLGARTQQAGNQARKTASDLQEANKAAGLENARKGAVNITNLDKRLKKASGALKKFITAAAAAVVGSSFHSAMQDVMSFTYSLADSAKGLKKTVEETRAYNTALQVMGKTAKEIEGSAALTDTFNQLQAIGAEMALPQAAQGMKAIEGLKEGLTQLKFVSSYALQWLMYKIQSVADGPLKEVRTMMGNVRQWLTANIENIAEAFATAFSWIVQLGTSAVTAITEVLGWLDKLPPAIKLVGAAVLTVVAMMKSRFALITGIVTGVLLLVDDLVTYLDDGESLFGGFWGFCIDLGQKAIGVITSVYNWFARLGRRIYDSAVEARSFGDFIKRLIMGTEYDPDETSWADVGNKIWSAINSGISAVGDWIKKLVLGDSYIPDSSWADVGAAIWDAIKGGIKAVGDWVKKLVLRDSYTPDSSWSEIGGKIWETIKSGIHATGDWIKQKVLGDFYTPDSTWADVGGKIWETVKGGISATGDWLKERLGYTPDTSWSEIGGSIWETIKSGISSSSDWLKERLGYTPDDSWSSVGADIWGKIKSGISAAGDWLKDLIGFSPDDSWSKIGSAIWGKIKAGISSAGDWLKGLIGFSPDDSWSSIGGQILTKIKSGISAAGDWLKDLIGFTPDNSWSSIGTQIWNAIKGGISATGDWLKGLIGFTPDDSWSSIGGQIWTSIKGGISAAGDWLKGLIGFTPDTSWSDIGGQIWASIRSGISAAGDWLKGLIGFTPDTSWSEIGGQIWGSIKSGITVAGDWLKGLVGFSPDASWSEVGTGIWNTIKSGITSAGDWLKGLVGFSPDASWSKIGASIWTTIKSGITAAGDWLKGLVGFTPDTSWSAVGGQIWKNIKSGIKATGDWLKGLIGYTPDDSWSEIGTEIWKKIESGINSAAKSLDLALGTDGAVESAWSSIKGIVSDISAIIGEIAGALTGKINTDSLTKAGETIGGTFQSAIVVISEALKSAEGAIGWIKDIVSKAAEMGILDDAIRGIAATLIVMKGINAAAPIVNLFKAFTTGSKVIGLVNPKILLITAAVVALAAAVSAAASAWNRMMYGISEAESNSMGLDNLRLKFDELSQTMNALGIDSVDALKEHIGSISEFMQEAVANNANFTEDMRATLMNFNDNQWMELYELYREKGTDAIEEFVNGVQEAADEAEITAPTLNTDELEQQAENAGESIDDLIRQLQELDENGNAELDVDASSIAGAIAEAKAALSQVETEMKVDVTATSGNVDTSAAESGIQKQVDDKLGNVTADTEVTVNGGVTVQTDITASTGAAMGSEFVDAVAIAIQAGISAVQTAVQGIAENLSPLTAAFESAQGIVEGAAGAMSAALKTAAAGIGDAVKDIQGVINSMKGETIISAFTDISSSIASSMATAASAVSRQVSAIKSALSSIPTSISVTVGAKKAFSMGGVVNQETNATIGEDGKEYVIPVTKPGRAVALLRQAARDLGMNVESSRNALKMLGGSADVNYTPPYSGSTAGSQVYNNCNNKSSKVETHDTFNVYGNDSRSIADNISRNRNQLITHNMKSAFA